MTYYMHGYNHTFHLTMVDADRYLLTHTAVVGRLTATNQILLDSYELEELRCAVQRHMGDWTSVAPKKTELEINITGHGPDLYTLSFKGRPDDRMQICGFPRLGLLELAGLLGVTAVEAVS